MRTIIVWVALVFSTAALAQVTTGAVAAADSKQISDSITKIEKDVDSVRNSINLTLGEQGKLISMLSYVTAVVLGFVALLFAGAVYFMHKEHAQVLARATDQLKECESLKTKFQSWFQEQEQDYKKAFAGDLKEYQRDVENLNRFMQLQHLIENPPFEPVVIFPLLTPLTTKPKLLYRPLFAKVIALQIGDAITEKAKEGIAKLA
jgi:hypothetical protein